MRDAIKRLDTVRASFRLPNPPHDVLCKTEQAAKKISAQEHEPWDKFWRRISGRQIDDLKAREQLRLISEVWFHAEANDVVHQLLDWCSVTTRSAPSNMLIETFIRHFPQEHPSFHVLASTCAAIASSAHSPWHSCSEELRFGDPDVGTERLAKLIENKGLKEAMHQVNFSREAQRGRFVSASIEVMCREYNTGDPEQLEGTGLSLIKILETDQFIELRALIVFSLLSPWKNVSPTRAYKNRLVNVLMRFGDPREYGPKWTLIEKTGRELFDDFTVDRSLELITRWLGEESIQEFFRIINKTAGNAQQWRAREQFWSKYLDAGLIEEAWFALGPVAQKLTKSTDHLKSVQYAKLIKGAASKEQSSLIMRIGGIIIAEWSDDGACRFWYDGDSAAPRLYEKEYRSTDLRAKQRDIGDSALPHNWGWENVFAQQIEKMTSITQPR